MAGLVPAIHVLIHAPAEDVDARDKPGHDDGESSAHARPFILQIPRDAVISPAFIARTGEICMTIMYSQIAPSRPMPMLDACVAL